MGGRFKKEGTYVSLWLIHVDVWQKPKQYCKAIILHLKIDKKIYIYIYIYIYICGSYTLVSLSHHTLYLVT